MDVEKLLAGVRKVLGMADDASLEKITRKLEALAALAAVDAEPEGGEPEPAPAPEAALADDKVDDDDETVAASATQLADPPPVLPAEVDAIEGAAVSAMDRLAEMTGLDEASVLEAMDANLEQIAALLMGTANTDGVPAEAPVDQAALSASEAKQAALSARVAKRDAEVVALTKRLAELEHGECERKIDAAIASGVILANSRGVFLSLAKADKAEFNRQLGAQEGTPAVPMGKLVADATVPEPDAGAKLSPDVRAFAERVCGRAKINPKAALKQLEKVRN